MVMVNYLMLQIFIIKDNLKTEKWMVKDFIFMTNLHIIKVNFYKIKAKVKVF